MDRANQTPAADRENAAFRLQQDGHRLRSVMADTRMWAHQLQSMVAYARQAGMSDEEIARAAGWGDMKELRRAICRHLGEAA